MKPNPVVDKSYAFALRIVDLGKHLQFDKREFTPVQTGDQVRHEHRGQRRGGYCGPHEEGVHFTDVYRLT